VSHVSRRSVAHEAAHNGRSRLPPNNFQLHYDHKHDRITMSQSARNNPDLPPVHDITPTDARKRGKRTGRPISGPAPRLRIFAYVAESSCAAIQQWISASKDPRCRAGQVVDGLVKHGKATGWSTSPEAVAQRRRQAAADVAAEERTEGRTLPAARVNPHD
jgi:hypothetical protein